MFTLIRRCGSVFMNAITVLLMVSGIGICTVGIAFLCIWLWRTGWLDSVLPAVREAEQVKVSVYGPAIAIRGLTADFHVDTVGKSGRPEWLLLSPEGKTGHLRVSTDGKRAEFQSLDDGVYTLYVAVGGEAMQVAQGHIRFENLELTEAVPEPVQQDLIQMPQMSSVMAPPPRATVNELTHGALATVESDDKSAEARMVAGSINSVMARIRTGNFPVGADPAVAIAEMVSQNMGERAKKWETFLIAVGAILAYQHEEGVIAPADKIHALNEMYNILLHVQ
jgi:hypothetical protein